LFANSDSMGKLSKPSRYPLLGQARTKIGLVRISVVPSPKNSALLRNLSGVAERWTELSGVRSGMGAGDPGSERPLTPDVWVPCISCGHGWAGPQVFRHRATCPRRCLALFADMTLGQVRMKIYAGRTVRSRLRPVGGGIFAAHCHSAPNQSSRRDHRPGGKRSIDDAPYGCFPVGRLQQAIGSAAQLIRQTCSYMTVRKIG
jgi:hypothetical protein